METSSIFVDEAMATHSVFLADQVMLVIGCGLDICLRGVNVADCGDDG